MLASNIPETPETQDNYLIRRHGEPQFTDSEGFEYVKTYNDRSLAWTCSAERAKRIPYAEACEVQRRLKEVQTECEIVPAPVGVNYSTPSLGEPVERITLRTVTDDEWTIKKGKSGKFCITRRSDGAFLTGVIVQADNAYEWGETEEEAKMYDSLAAAEDYASQVLLSWLGVRGLGSQVSARAGFCPHSRKWHRAKDWPQRPMPLRKWKEMEEVLHDSASVK
jgi:hypothetical protein